MRPVLRVTATATPGGGTGLAGRPQSWQRYVYQTALPVKKGPINVAVRGGNIKNPVLADLGDHIFQFLPPYEDTITLTQTTWQGCVEREGSFVRVRRIEDDFGSPSPIAPVEFDLLIWHLYIYPTLARCLAQKYVVNVRGEGNFKSTLFPNDLADCNSRPC